MRPNPQSAEHADKLVQVLKTWLAERDDKHIVAWIMADQLRAWAHSQSTKQGKSRNGRFLGVRGIG